MAQSLVKLTLESNDYEKKLRQAQRSLDDFTNKIGINMKALTSASVAAAAVTGAIKVFGDALKANEAMVDEWGRTMRGAQAAYDGFLNALNNGDISGYLNRIDTIIYAARRAYDEMDRLGTMRTIQAPKVSAQQAENDRMRAMLQTGRYIAPTDGRKAAMATGTLLTDEQKKRIAQQLENGTKTVIRLMENEVKQHTKGIDAIYEEYAAKLGMSKSEFQRGTSSMDVFEQMVAGGKQYEQWKKEHSRTLTAMGSTLTTVESGNPYEKYKGWSTFRVDGEEYNRLVEEIRRRDQQMSQIYGMYGQTYRTINRAEGVSARIGKGGKSAKTITAATEEELPFTQQLGLIGELEEKLKDVQAMLPFANTKEEIIEVNQEIKTLTEQLDELRNLGKDIPMEDMFEPALGPLQEMNKELRTLHELLESAPDASTYQEIYKKIAGKEKEISKFKGEDKTEVSLTDEFGKMTSGISSIVSGIEQLGIDIPEGLGKVIGTLQTFMTIVSGIATTVTAIAAISMADAIIPFRRGGIVPQAAGGWRVPGHDYSDRTPVLVSSGELILNKAQQGNLASQLGGGLGNLNLSATISGEQIRLVLNNNGRRTGRGEYVTTNFR